MSLTLLPALDIAGGKAVRPAALAAGTPEEQDPLALALQWQAEGAEWIHLVDLDAAYGRGSNTALLTEIVAALDIPVQLSGGIRDAASLEVALSALPTRVNLATDSLADERWVHAVVGELGERVTVALDVAGDRLRPRGAGGDAGPWREVLVRLDLAGACRYVVTAVASDGAMSGPDLPLLRSVCALTDRPVVASGGIGTLGDLGALASLESDGVEGVVLGTALATGAFTLTQALGQIPR